MLYIVNPELVEQQLLPPQAGRENPYQTAQYYCTSQAIRTEKDSTEPISKAIPLFRIISDITEFNDRPMNIVTMGEEGSKNTRTTVRALPKNKNDSTVIILAIPFNGKMDPLEDSDAYKIHKGVLVNSDAYSIALTHFPTQKYRKVLYLIIETKDEDFEIKFVSHSKRYNKKDKDSKEFTWNEDVVTVSFNAEEGIKTVKSHSVLQTWENSTEKKQIFTPAPPFILKDRNNEAQNNVTVFSRESAKRINKFYTE